MNSLTAPQPDSLYIILFITGLGEEDDTYHWGLYYKSAQGGFKYHVKNAGSGWIVDHGPVANTMKSFLLVGLLRIARVHPTTVQAMHNLIVAEDHLINVEGMSCVVWCLASIRRLTEVGIVHCSNLAQLQFETNAFGNSNRSAALQNRQPRPIMDSQLCGL